jgi:undecaprenyl-diphosphatase
MLVVLVIGGCAAVACGADAPAGGGGEEPQRISTLQAIILGAIQGLTEYLPVSSTGHLILANYWMDFTRCVDDNHKLTSGFTKNQAVDAFDIVLHAGTFLAVLGLYRKRVGQMAKGLVGTDPGGLQLVAALALAFLPAAVIGYKFKGTIEENLYNPVTVAAALAVGGVLMIVIEHYFWRRRRGTQRVTDVAQVRLWQALVIGLAQCLAMWPGTSRSMITILAALVIGLDMLAAAEFSFLLALPTLGAATLYTAYKDWPELVAHVGPLAMAAGLVATVIVAALAIKGFVKWLTGHGLLPFGIYRLALAAVVFAYFAL